MTLTWLCERQYKFHNNSCPTYRKVEINPVKSIKRVSTGRTPRTSLWTHARRCSQHTSVPCQANLTALVFSSMLSKRKKRTFPGTNSREKVHAQRVGNRVKRGKQRLAVPVLSKHFLWLTSVDGTEDKPQTLKLQTRGIYFMHSCEKLLYSGQYCCGQHPQNRSYLFLY